MRDKTGKIVAKENAKLKLLKLLSSKNNVISFFFTTANPGDI